MEISYTRKSSRLNCAQLLVIALTGWLMLASHPACSASTEEDTLRRLAKLRAFQPNSTPEELAQYNEQMDEAWQFYHAHKEEAMPVLRRELAAELRRPQPAQLLLLDVASYLYLDGDTDDRQIATQALLAIAPESPIIQANFDQLFRLTHGLAAAGDPRLLDFIDRNFLVTERSVIIGEHSLTLNGTLICAFLYGVYGLDGERHLQPKLKDPQLAERVLEALKWVGSPDSVPAVEAAMSRGADYELFTRALTFMMINGGPQGQAVMLRADRKTLDPQSRQQYEKAQAAIESQSYALLRKRFDSFSGEGKLSDEQLKQGLAAMYESHGKDDRLNPKALLDSKLPKEFLIGELLRIRARMFDRLSDEALSDVELTNAVLNTLRYRDY